MRSIKYRKGYKYQLWEYYQLQTNIKPAQNISVDFISLTTDGVLTISAGYAWDGASGPAIDTKNFLRGSLVHDALYQLIGMGYLFHELKNDCDKLLVEICKQDGMSWIRSKWVYLAVKTFGKGLPPEDILTAP